VFDKREGYAEVDVVEDCKRYLKEKIASGEFVVPAEVSYAFAGTYENQVCAQKKLVIVVPLALFIIFMILCSQFKSTVTSLLVFSGIIVAWAGGFLLIWVYSYRRGFLRQSFSLSWPYFRTRGRRCRRRTDSIPR